MDGERLLNGTLNSVQDTRHTEQLGDREEDGKTISTNSSNSKTTRPKTLRKAKTNHGSKLQKTVENGFYLKKNTMTAEKRSENNARQRRNRESRRARYVNGVRLSEDEVADITSNKVKEKCKLQKMKQI